MRTKMLLSCLAATALLGACKEVPKEAPEPPPAETTAVEAPEIAMGTPTASTGESNPATAPHRFASWSGKWTGVEGMYVNITPTDPGHYSLEMQSDLDTKGIYVGSDSEHGIRFTRGGEPFSLHRGGGDESGLKYLAGKRECLIVKQGEGYCRD